MTVASDLQDIVADLSVAIASRRQLGRVELEKLRRQLQTACAELAKENRGSVTARMVLSDLIDGVEDQTANLAGLAERARRIAGIQADAAKVTA